jgi:TDG/mug DNA glycosylase family protein
VARAKVPGWWRPTKAQIAAAEDALLPDVIADELRVLFVGINPSLYSAATGHHFARPGNRFWPALHRSGFTPRELDPFEDRELLEYGVGLTNIAPRATARADQLDRDELRAGARSLVRKVRRRRPAWVGIVGVTAYREAFERPKARMGRQEETLGGAGLWILPNPSGLNAHYQLPDLARLYAELWVAARL